MLNKSLLLIGALLLQGRGAPPVPPPPAPAPVFIGPGEILPPFALEQRAQQQLPPGTATVDGVVTILGTSDPVPGAVIEMRKTECGRTGGESMTTTSGPDGRFSFTQVRAGNWCIGAAKAGGALSPVEYRQRGYKSRGLAVPVADNEQIRNINLMMPRTGSISGRVLDSDGEPMVHARVQAMEAFYQDGQKRLYSLNIVQTNDRGEFSLSWLPPGEYYVSAVPEDPSRRTLTYTVAPPGMGGHRSDAMSPVVVRRNLPDGSFTEEVYRPVYYGGGSDPQRAQKLVVRPGSSNVIEISFAGARTASFHVRGRVMNGVTGQPAEGAQVRLYPREWTATAVVPYASVDKSGNFDIRGVAPGSYALFAAASVRDPNAPGPAAIQGAPPALLQELIAQGGNINIGRSIPIGARLPVEMGNQNLENISLTLLPGGALVGEFIFEGNLATLLTPQQKSSLRVSLARQPDIPGAALGGASTGGMAPNAVDTSFRLQNIFPGDFRVFVSPLVNPFSSTTPAQGNLLGNVFVRSIRYGSTDVLNDGLRLETHNPNQRLQIILAPGGTLAGVVTNDRREALANVKVALIPDFAYRNRDELYKSATTDASGKFSIQGIAAGDYRVFSWEDIVDGAWQDAEVLREVEGRAKTVRIREGETTAVEVLAIPGGRQ
jgi:hypothetical protein